MSILKKIGSGLRSIFSPLRKIASVYGYVHNYYPYANQLEQLEQIRHYRNWVYIAINALMSRVSQQVPVVATKRHRSDVKSKKYLLDKYARSKALTSMRSFEELEVVPANHRLVKLLRKPNTMDTSADLWQETVLFYELTANAYWWTPLDADGIPYEIWVIPSHWVRPIIDEKALISHYEIRPYEMVSSVLDIDADEIIHFKKPSPFSKILGFSTLSAVNNWVDTEESNSLSRYFTLKNSVQPGLLLKVDPDADFDPTDDTEMERIGLKFLNAYAGEVKAAKPILLNKMSVLPPPTLPEEMKYLESEDQLRDMILAAYGVTKVAVGLMDEVNRAAFIAGMTQFSVNAVNPRLSYFSQVMTEKLCPKFGEDGLAAYFEDSTPNDPDVINERVKTMAATNSIRLNEIRGEYGYEKLDPEKYPWADDILVPLNVGPMGLSNTHEDVTIGGDEERGGDISEGVDTSGDVEQSDLLSTVGGIEGAIDILEKYGAGTITAEQARGMLKLFFKFTDEQTRVLIPDTLPPVIQERIQANGSVNGTAE